MQVRWIKGHQNVDEAPPADQDDARQNAVADDFVGKADQDAYGPRQDDLLRVAHLAATRASKYQKFVASVQLAMIAVLRANPRAALKRDQAAGTGGPPPYAPGPGEEWPRAPAQNRLQFVPPPQQLTVDGYLSGLRWDPTGPATTWLELLIDYELHHQMVYIPPAENTDSVGMKLPWNSS